MSRTRFAPLIGSLWLAAVFIGVRVFWRLVAGEFSWPSAASAAWAALPFAAIIMACGLLSSLIDIRRMLLGAGRLRLGGALATALAIGLASVSELAAVARSARQAQLLRGSRRRAALLIPILEHAIERALALAAALEVRGWFARSQAVPTADDVRFQGVTLRHGGRAVLRDVTLTLRPGLSVLTGPTGGGKTSLLETISGLSTQFHGGVLTGEVSVCGIDRSAPIRTTAHLIGTLGQQVRLGFIGDTVAAERAFTRARPASTLAVSTPSYSHRVVELSAGEAVQLGLDVALARSPRVLLLDEPFADLDADARALLLERLRAEVARGSIVLVAEHHTAELATLEPRWLTVTDGHVREGRWHPPASAPPRSAAVIGTDLAVQIAHPQFSYRGASLSSDISADLPVGALIAVTGPNGAGKSSLLAGLAEPTPGSVTVRGVDAAGKIPRPSSVALVPEQVSEFFLAETLAEELAGADRIAGATPGLTELTLRSLLRSTDIDALLGTHPRDLSAGTQRALAIALQLSHKPGLLLVDEPTRGLDPGARADMAEVLCCVAETGTVVLFATHDLGFAAGLTAECWRMADGVVMPGPSLDCAALHSGTDELTAPGGER